MFYIDETTGRWIESVINSMNERQLKPENSRFMIAIFSSMDKAFVKYFKRNKSQISSVSGDNFHVFTPLIYDNDVIPDNKWRLLKKDFNERGIPVNTDPFLIFFELKKLGSEFIPYFYAGYNVVYKEFNNKLKKTIEETIGTPDIKTLVRKLNQIFLTPNVISDNQIGENYKHFIAEKVNRPTIFISHSSMDKPFVHELLRHLKEIKSKFWIDEREIKVGDSITQDILTGIKSTDIALVVISKKSIQSEWVKFELSQFISNHTKIIPVLLSKNIEFPEPYRTQLKDISYLDFSDLKNWHKNINKLREALDIPKVEQ